MLGLIYAQRLFYDISIDIVRVRVQVITPTPTPLFYSYLYTNTHPHTPPPHAIPTTTPLLFFKNAILIFNEQN